MQDIPRTHFYLPTRFPDSLTAAMMMWFGKDPALDDQIRADFGALIEEAAQGHLDAWSEDPCECTVVQIS